MALKPCRECKELVSTDATACPKCGARSPTSFVAEPAAAIGCLVVILLIGGAVAVGMIQDAVAPSHEKSPLLLDHSKPWYTRAGWPLCATKGDLANLLDNLSLDEAKSLKERKWAVCIPAPDGMRVVEVEQDGSFAPDYRVRLPSGALVWIPGGGVRN